MLCLAALAILSCDRVQSDAEIVEQSKAKIEQLRKGPARVRVVDAQGNPVAGASITVEQLKHRFLFGCQAMDLFRLKPAEEDAYEKAFADLFNYGEVGTHWSAYEAKPGVIGDQLLKKQCEWLQAHDMAIMGHSLVYHQGWPAWLSNTDIDAGRAAIKNRISREMHEFAGTIKYWVVINEAVQATDFKTPNGITAWAQRDGIGKVVEEVLIDAKQSDSSAKLIVNDTVDANVLRPDYVASLEKILGEADAANAPFDFVGLQFHQHAGELPLNQILDSVDEIARKSGKPIQITETSFVSGEHARIMRGPKVWPSTPEGEQQQAGFVTNYYRALFADPNVNAICWWDLQDGRWMGAPSGLIRADYSAKPAYTALRKLIKEEWWTNESLTTSADGTASFRGFYGDYKITVAHDRAKASVTGSLTPSSPNTFTVQIL